MVGAFYNQIGQAAISEAPSLAGRLLVQAEVEDGVISAKLFYETAADAPLAFRFCSSSMEDLIYSFWEAWRTDERNKEWRVMCYVIDEGKFSIDLTYPEQLSPEEGDLDRRPGILKKYFGEVKVDYSKPD